MALFTRPKLDDDFFEQLPENELTLNGDTNFNGILRSKGIEIDASVTGDTQATVGQVLAYSPNGKIILQDLVPKVVNPPVATLTGGGLRQFGNNAGFNLLWSATRETNPISSIVVAGQTINSSVYENLASGQTTGNITQAATIATPNQNQTYNITVTDSEGLTDSKNTTITFRHKRWFFADSRNLFTFDDNSKSTIIQSYENSSNSEYATTQVKASFTKTFSSQFFYYAYPASFGNALFRINGLLNNDFTVSDITYINIYGYAETFKLYRNNQLLNSTYSIEVLSA